MEMLGGKFGLNIVKADAAKRFPLTNLLAFLTPEQKRKIIGNEFVYVFDDEVSKAQRREIPCSRNPLYRRYRVWYRYSSNYQSHTTTWVVFRRHAI